MCEFARQKKKKKKKKSTIESSPCRLPPPPQTLGKCEWAELTVYRHELAGHPDHPLSISLARAVYVHASQVAKEADAVEHA